jgi:hypothetical protein
MKSFRTIAEGDELLRHQPVEDLHAELHRLATSHGLVRDVAHGGVHTYDGDAHDESEKSIHDGMKGMGFKLDRREPLYVHHHIEDDDPDDLSARELVGHARLWHHPNGASAMTSFALGSACLYFHPNGATPYHFNRFAGGVR